MLKTTNNSNSLQLAEAISRLFANCQEKETRYVAQYGISIVEFRSIRILFEHQQLTVNQLAQHMALTSSRITRIIDGLVSKNLVSRESDHMDRRIYNLSLTIEGKKLAVALIQGYNKMYEKILNCIPVDLQNPMIKSLTQLNEAIEKYLDQDFVNNGSQL